MEGLNLFSALQFGYFEHNSFVFENLLMGLVVLESLFYALSVSCCEFLHLKCRDFVNQVCRTAVFWIRDFGIVILCNDLGGFKKGFWE